MWRILVFLTGSLGLFLVLFLIIFIGFSESSWQAWACGGACALFVYFIICASKYDYVKRERKLRKDAKRKAKLERIKKAQMEKKRLRNLDYITFVQIF